MFSLRCLLFLVAIFYVSQGSFNRGHEPTLRHFRKKGNGTQFQKLTDLLSVLVSEAIGKYINPTRYGQIIEQQFVSEDQESSLSEG